MAKVKRKRLEWLMFYPMDFIRGTREMSNEEVGAYIRLMCESWMNSVNGTVPPNIKNKTISILAALPQTSRKDWNRIKKSVLSKFDVDTLEIKGETVKVLVNHRLTEEQDLALQDSKAQSDRAKKRDYGKAPALPGHIPGNAAGMREEIEKENSDRKNESTGGQSPNQGDNDMAKEKTLHKKLARIWQEEKHTEGALCPYPHFQREAFEDMARTTAHDAIEDAFRLFAKDARGADEEKYPIDTFSQTKNAGRYLALARPEQTPLVDEKLIKADKELEARLLKAEADANHAPALVRNEMSAEDFLKGE